MVIAMSLWFAALSAGSTVTRQKAGNTTMDYDQRQQYVEDIRHALEQNWDGSPVVLREHAADKPEELRRDIYAFYWRLGTVSPEPAKRAAVVEFMLDKTVEETPTLRGQLLKWLQDFGEEDFNQNARLRLNNLPWTSDYCPEVIRLIGIAELEDAKPRLIAQVEDDPLPKQPPPGYEHRNTWVALLALARLGDESALAAVLGRVQQEKNIITRAPALFYDLGYTRRQAAFDLLKSYLNSDKRLPQTKPTVPGRLEAAHAAAVFSRFIREFPIQETDFDELQTYEARNWVNAQSSWQLK